MSFTKKGQFLSAITAAVADRTGAVEDYLIKSNLPPK